MRSAACRGSNRAPGNGLYLKQILDKTMIGAPPGADEGTAGTIFRIARLFTDKSNEGTERPFAKNGAAGRVESRE